MRRESDAGFALVATLVVLAFLSIMALMLAQKFRASARISAMKMESVEAGALSQAALTRAIIALTDPDLEKAWKPDGVAHAIDLDGHKVSIKIRDELGKLDINTADPELLKRLFVHVQEDEGKADQLVAAMEDWRDQDNTRRPLGAEAADYRREGRNHLPANAPFEKVSELAWVPGMSDALFACVAPALTVHSQRRSIDESRAHPLLAEALDLEIGSVPTRAVSAIRGGLGGRAFELEIVVPLKEGRDVVTRTILRITENSREPLWILARDDQVSVGASENCKPGKHTSPE